MLSIVFSNHHTHLIFLQFSQFYEMSFRQQIYKMFCFLRKKHNNFCLYFLISSFHFHQKTRPFLHISRSFSSSCPVCCYAIAAFRPVICMSSFHGDHQCPRRWLLSLPKHCVGKSHRAPRFIAGSIPTDSSSYIVPSFPVVL